ncbi:MAG: TIGR01777 family oxidoreductase [Verrucomicrobiales bacterium]|nr:TIGR01777 family oxidoreductase [Verrucomicrobiales bacterium]
MKKETKERVVLAGGSGFLGKALAGHLHRSGYDVVVLTRNPKRYDGAGRALFWNGETVEEHWRVELEGAKALVNLAGKNVNCRQTKANREEILRSRVLPTETLGNALRLVYRVPEVWVQAGSLAIYGNAGNRVCDESAFIPDEYPTDVCIAWEEVLGRAVRPEMRWAMLRIGFVLGRDGGALPALANLARLGLGGAIGGGKQWISWIHIDDMVRLFREAIENPAVYGIFNATGLQPVPNREFMVALRNTLNVPFGLPAPAPLVRLGAPLMGADPDLALNGRRGLPVKIHGHGFRFRFHELDDALADLLAPKAATTQPGWGQPFGTKTLAR